VPFAFDFDWKHRILRVHLRGHVSDEQLREFYPAGFKIAFRMQPLAGLIDTREVTLFRVLPETVRLLAKSAPMIPDPKLVRVAIAPKPEVYGMMRMFELHGEATRPNFYVVREEREAWAILGIQNPRFDPLDLE